jgi:putative transposase
MRTGHYTITAAAVQREARLHLQHHLQLRDHGPKCTAAALLTLIFWAASCCRSLAAACAALRRAPSDQACRQALLATLPEYHLLQCRLNHALAGGLPKALRRRKQRLALDLHLIPYYGHPENDDDELYRGAKKAGTKLFHGYATAYVIFKGCRWTVALLPVTEGDPWADLVKQLLQQARKTGVQIGLVLLDRGFYSVEVIRYLQAARYPFLMPVVRRGRKPDHAQGASGTWAFTTWKRSGWSSYVLENQKGKRATVRICVCVLPPEKQRRRGPSSSRPGKRQKRVSRRVLVYAFWGVQPSTVSWVRETYRQRFGIESSYRQLGEARIHTTTRSPLLRLFYVGVALVLRNIWVWLHWEVLALKRRGRRLVDLEQLPFRALLHWLLEVAEACFGRRLDTESQRPFTPLLT